MRNFNCIRELLYFNTAILHQKCLNTRWFEIWYGHIASSNDWNQPFKHYIELFSIVATCTGGQYYIYTTYKSSFGMQIISFCSEKLFYIFFIARLFSKIYIRFFFKYLTGFLGKEKQSCIFFKNELIRLNLLALGMIPKIFFSKNSHPAEKTRLLRYLLLHSSER